MEIKVLKIHTRVYFSTGGHEYGINIFELSKSSLKRPFMGRCWCKADIWKLDSGKNLGKKRNLKIGDLGKNFSWGKENREIKNLLNIDLATFYGSKQRVLTAWKTDLDIDKKEYQAGNKRVFCWYRNNGYCQREGDAAQYLEKLDINDSILYQCTRTGEAN